MKTKIKDSVFTTKMSNRFGDMKLEFYVCNTNELHPYREIRELGIVMFGQAEQFDGGLEYDDLVDFIKYLNKVKKHIKTFNDNSKPTE